MQQSLKKSFKSAIALSSAVCALPLASAALGAEWADWASMKEEVVSGDRLLSADISNGLNPIGSVKDIVLTPDKQGVEYILYNVPYPYSLFGPAENGFTTFEGANFHYDPLSLTVLLEEERPQAPEQIELTREEAEERLLSNIIGEDLHFSGDQLREITDVLIDRETGELRHFVVAMDSDSLFGQDPHLIPADRVTIDDQGSTVTSMDISAVETVGQDYGQEFL